MFLDSTGSRWRRVRAALLLLMVVLLGAVVAVLPPIFDAPRLAGARRAPQPAVDTTANTVLVGTGPLVRVIRPVQQGGVVVGYDAASGLSTGVLTGEDADKARGRSAVMQRYGYPAGSQRTISLTFDDGPDPRYTPELLDLLSRQHVPATFFDIGSAAVKFPDLVAREAREGHLVANHTMTHPDIEAAPSWRSRAELVSTDRTLRSLTGQQTPFMRLPYEGDDEGSTTQSMGAVLRAQQLGYVVASHDFDSLDWLHAKQASLGAIPLPDLDGRNLTILLHDGGGDRHLTVGYVERLIRAAKANGYRFDTMATAQAGIAPPSGRVSASLWDDLARDVATATFAWPGDLLDLLFLFALTTVLTGLLYAGLAVLRRLRRRGREFPPDAEQGLTVSVVLAAYNEEGVIRRTVESILASSYPLLEVVVVDDGSKDGTAGIVRELARGDDRLTLVQQPNAGKAHALNHGMQVARGEFLVTLDADTVLTTATVGNLVRHFAVDHDGRLGAVAGALRVGNRTRNLLTRWQALEYLTQIGVERSAQDLMGAIAIVPGACAAWRAEAIRSVGGYSDHTLAEDCDLSLCLHREGWRITQDDDAIAYTEAPEDVDGLLAQRIRWSYGTLQAIYKHRDMLFRPRYGWLGSLVLPNYVLSILMPVLFMPLTTVMAVLMVQRQGWAVLALYAAAFTVAHVVIAAVAVRLMRESAKHLLMVPIYRVVFEPLRAYLLYTSTYMAVRGVQARWNKLARSGSLDAVLLQPPRAVLATAATTSVPVPVPVSIRAPIPVTTPGAGPRARSVATGTDVLTGWCDPVSEPDPAVLRAVELVVAELKTTAEAPAATSGTPGADSRGEGEQR